MNQNMSGMEHMAHFIRDQKTPKRMFLDASTVGTLISKNENKVKEFIENIC